MRNLWRVATLAALCGIASSILSIGIRHDRNEKPHLDLAKESPYECVGLVLIKGEPKGSCVLISGRIALTAAHVVEKVAKEDIKLQFGRSKVDLFAIKDHPGHRPANPTIKDALYVKGVDLAALTLASAITDVAPATLYEADKEIGKEGTMVGFGSFGIGSQLVTNTVSPGTKRGGKNMIDQIGGTVKGRSIPDWYLIADFDGPGFPELNATGSAEPLDLESLAVGGDSGSGLFIQEGGKTYLVGILASITFEQNDDLKKQGVYGSRNYWVRTHYCRDWVKGQLN